MTSFKLRHASIYTFSAPVILGPHQLYLRPRGDHKMRVAGSSLTLSPPAEVLWRNDLYGNSVAIAKFAGQSDRLEIISELDVETFPRSEEQRRSLLETGGFLYSPVELRVLEPFTIMDPVHVGPVADWVEHASLSRTKSIYERLLECAARIKFEFDYRVRYEPGLQTPAETLQLHSGTCRDFAELMMAAARYLGYAARFITGYVYTPNAAPGSSSPHAWAEVYIPGSGWIEVDATNGLIDDGDLIPVASASSGAELTPISGTFEGADVTSQMTVEVDVVKQG